MKEYTSGVQNIFHLKSKIKGYRFDHLGAWTNQTYAGYEFSNRICPEPFEGPMKVFIISLKILWPYRATSSMYFASKNSTILH